MKELFEIMVQLPFGDYATLEYEMTEEEYDDFLEYSGDESIWEAEQFDEMLCAAAVAAANYIVGFYCEEASAEDIDEESCTIEKLMNYYGECEDDIAEVMTANGKSKREVVASILYENEAFTLE